MENNKIVDYLVVKQKCEITDFNTRKENVNYSQKYKEQYASVGKIELEEELEELTDEIDKLEKCFPIKVKIENDEKLSPYENEIWEEFFWNFYEPEREKDITIEMKSSQEIYKRIKWIQERLESLNTQLKSIIKRVEIVKKETEEINRNKISKIPKNKFENEIVSLITKGYQPQGGLNIDRGYLYQAMIKYDK